MRFIQLIQLITALYLAHLNPVTNAHVEIISELKKEADIVKVMPVVFKDGDKEINSKSFPFNFETRKKMLVSVFGDSIQITDDYAFFAPFKKYLPPLFAPKSWQLRKQILRGVEGDYFSYTGDKAEGYMLKIIAMTRPKIAITIHNARKTKTKKTMRVRALIYFAVTSEIDFPWLRNEITSDPKS